jgi:hypothetical protein
MQRMVQIKDNQIIKYSLPKTGQLKDGSTVSGYDILPLETLLTEGWLPLEDIQPEHDKDTQYILDDGYEILTDRVIKKYKVEDIIIEEPTEPQPTEEQQRLLDLEIAMAQILGGGI